MTSTNTNSNSTVAAAAAAAAGPIVAEEISSETRHDAAIAKKSHQAAASASTAALHENIDDVAWAFVEQYYMILHSDPERLHLFYNKDSTAIHGVEAHNSKHAVGQQEIHKLITNDKFKSCKVMISNIDCQKTFGNGVLIQVIGEMANEGQPAQKFIQSFLLAPQNAGYYVHNDVLRFLKEDAGSEYDFSEEVYSDATTPAVEEPVAVASEKKEEEVKPEPKAEKSAVPEPVAEPVAAPAPAAEPKPVSVVEAKPAEPKPVEAEPTKKAEKPVEKPTEKPATPAEKPVAAPAKKPTASSIPPALPATPMSWAARAAVKPVSAPAAPAVNGTATPVAAPAPVPAAAPAAAPVPTPATAASSTVNVQGHRRGPREFFSAYIKHVTENVQEKALKQALQDIGTVTHFEVARAKNCAFVDFVDLETLKKALAVHELKVGSSVVLIEERKRGGAKKNNNSSSSGHNNNVYGRRNNSGSNSKRRTNA